MPRPRSQPLFELGGQWIAAEPGKANLYRYWHDAGAGHTRRASLETADLAAAKKKLATIVVLGDVKTPDSLVSAVLLTYFEQHTDNLPSAKQSRSSGRRLIAGLGKATKARELTDAKQKAFAEYCVRLGFSLSYVARLMTVLKAALNMAGVAPPAAIVTSESTMRDKWHLRPKAARKRYVPTDDEMLRLWQAPKPERLRRWMILSALTTCRPSAALDLAPAARRKDARSIDLNPADRVQNKKFRPTVRETRVLGRFLDKWEEDGLDDFGGRYCGYTTIEGVKTALERLCIRADVNIPALSTYSFRHKMKTVLQRDRGVSAEERKMQMGHKSPDMRVDDGYGEWSPDYLTAPARCLDRYFLEIRRRAAQAKRRGFSHNIPTIVSERTKKAA